MRLRRMARARRRRRAVYWGVGNKHVRISWSPGTSAGEREAPTARGVVSQFIEHPSEVLTLSDPRHFGRTDHGSDAARRPPTPASSCTNKPPAAQRAQPARIHRCTSGAWRGVRSRTKIRLRGGRSSENHAVQGNLQHRLGARASPAACRSATTPTTAPSTPTEASSAARPLRVIDGSVMPANTGVNPSLSITALAEQALCCGRTRAEHDPRPPLGSGWERIVPVARIPGRRPRGTAGGAAVGRQKSDVIPDYPY